MTKEEFLDVRNHGFARVAVVIPKVALANPAGNATNHLERLQAAYDLGVQYAVCPELGLTGYTCGDLFHQAVLQAEALRALERLVHASDRWPGLMVSVGLPLRVGDALYNCAATFAQGKLLAVTPKLYPPEYREFYELRWFARGLEAQTDTVELIGEPVPFGPWLLIERSDIPGFILHVEICEDLWVPIPPSRLATLAGATVLSNLSASDSTLGKADYRRSLVAMASGSNNAVQLYSAAGYGESTTDLCWDAQGLIAERGTVIAESERFSRDGSTIIADVDLESCLTDRSRQSSQHENAADIFSLLGKPAGTMFRTVRARLARGPSTVFEHLERTIDPMPFVPSEPKSRDERCQEVFNIQAQGLMRRLEALCEGRRRIILGLSGGQDSTHALNVAVYAMDQLKLPRTDIIVLTLPGFGTTERTRNNALRLAEAYGIECQEIPIRPLAEAVFAAIGYEIKEDKPLEVVYENVQAWSRMLTLFAVSANEEGIVLGTGDLSELLLGWCTFGADHLSHYGLNAGVGKTLISHLIRWTAEVVHRDEPVVQAVLLDILATEISPELLPLAPDGQIVQKTEELIGPYELHDFFGYHFIRFGVRPRKLVRLALEAFGRGYQLSEIKRWLRVFLERLFRNQFKRSCLPDGPKVAGAAISPRGDWRMPSDASPDAWLADLELVPDEI